MNFGPWVGLLFNKVTLGIAISGALAWGYYEHRKELMQAGYDAAMTEVQDREDARLREQMRETGRLIDLVERLNNEARALEARVNLFAGRWRDAERLFDDQDRDFQRQLADARTEAVREYAKASDSNLEGCRRVVARFAREAAESSGVAHTLNDYIDAGPTCRVPLPVR